MMMPCDTLEQQTTTATAKRSAHVVQFAGFVRDDGKI
jgi:hypothetical protein